MDPSQQFFFVPTASSPSPQMGDLTFTAPESRQQTPLQMSGSSSPSSSSPSLSSSTPQSPTLYHISGFTFLPEDQSPQPPRRTPLGSSSSTPATFVIEDITQSPSPSFAHLTLDDGIESGWEQISSVPSAAPLLPSSSATTASGVSAAGEMVFDNNQSPLRRSLCNSGSGSGHGSELDVNIYVGKTKTEEQLIEELIYKYAPEVRIHSRDIHQPSSVEWYLDRCQLVNQLFCLAASD